LGRTLEGRLRLCFVSRYFPPMMGSGAPRMEDLSENLAGMGQEIHLVTVHPPRGFPRTRRRRGYSAGRRVVYRVRVPEGLPSPLYALLSTMGLLFKTLMVTLRSRVDLVLATVPNEDSGLAGWLAARITGRPFIVDVRDDWEIILIDESRGLERLLAKTIYYVFNILYSSADGVVCTSETLRRRVSARRGSAKGVHKVTNGARLELFYPADREERRAVRRRYGAKGRLAVFTGTLSRHQAPWSIVEAARELRSRGAEISTVVAGGGPLLGELRRLSAELGEPVRFVGPVSRGEAARLIAVSDIGVITLRDNIACRSMIPLKFYDYVAGGLPIVASVPVDSEIAEMIRGGQLGIVVEPENPIRLADAIEEMAEDRGLRRRVRKKMGQIAHHYSWRRLSRAYLDILLEATRS